MRCFLGFDTSNYTTSAAAYIVDENMMISRKKLIPVKEGELGARQSDAVFHHVRQLPALVKELFEHSDLQVEGIGVSTRPRPIDGSYMPCFEVGKTTASVLSDALGVSLHEYSHQEGHIAAALYSADCFDSIGDRFYAFHVSGGTTEAVLVTRRENGFDNERICGSLDLKAGQVIDRTAKMLSLPFPGGAYLEKLALEYNGKMKCKPTMKDADCCLSGIENKCRALVDSGADKCYVAAVCLEYIRVSLEAMTEKLLEREKLPVLYAGGVMSNSIIRKSFENKFGGKFAEPEYSSDNACGIALLASRAVNR